LKAYFQILGACLIWGTYGLFVQGLGYAPEVTVFFRFLFGAVFLVLLSALTGDLARLRPSSQTKWLILIGVVNSASWLMLTRSITYTSVANGFILYYTAPCFVVLLAPFLLRERTEKKSLPALLLSFAGVVLIAGQGSAGGPGIYSLWGNALGLASGILYALFILALKRLPPELLGLVSNTYMCATIALVSLPLAAPWLAQVTLPGIMALILLGVLIQGLASTMYMIGLRGVKAQHASILSYFEALFSIVFAALFLHEAITLTFLAGVVLIIAGGAVVVSIKAKEESVKSC